MTTTWPLRALTTESDSRTVDRASGSSKVSPPRVMTFSWSVISLMLGCMCNMTSPSSLICGVTSSAIPEKNGVSVNSGFDVVPAAVDVLSEDISVTKNSSEPTLITAFWLLTVETRGLDSTCTLPWVPNSVINEPKVLAELPTANRLAKAVLVTSSGEPTTTSPAALTVAVPAVPPTTLLTPSDRLRSEEIAAQSIPD